jgi:hypothetical protein
MAAVLSLGVLSPAVLSPAVASVMAARYRAALITRSHTRHGTWCDMASCGNMIKNRNFRGRRKQQRRPP